MCKLLKTILSVFSILIVVSLLCVWMFYGFNLELWDSQICNWTCKSNSLYTQNLPPEKVVIGIYKNEVKRCDCYIVHKDLEDLFRKEKDKRNDFEKKLFDKWFRRLYSSITLKLGGIVNDRNTSIIPFSSNSNSSK